MKKECGFTLTELMVVVAIVAVLSAIAIPMYMNNVRKPKVQEAVDTIGAIKDEISTYVPNKGDFPPQCRNHGQILDTVGVQVPENGKWRYRVRDRGIIFVRAQASLGQGLRGGWIRCTPQFDPRERAVTDWRWRCDGRRIKSSYLPK